MAATSNLYGRLDVTAVRAQFLDGSCAEAQCVLIVGANRQTSKDSKNNPVDGTTWNHGPIAFVLEGKETYLHVEVQHRSAFNGRVTPLGEARILLTDLVTTPEAWYRLGLGDHQQYAGDVLIRATFIGSAAGVKEEVKQPEKPVESKFGAAASAVRIPGSNATRVSIGSNSTLMALNGQTGNFFIWNAAQGRWNAQPGAAASVAAGADGDMWATSPQGGIYRFDPSGERFLQVEGPLADKVFAGGRNHVAIIDKSGKLHMWKGSGLHGPGGPTPWAEEKDAWQPIEQAAHVSPVVELGVGYDGALWAVHADKSIWQHSLASGQWQRIVGTATQVGVASNKVVAICNKDTGRFSRYDFKNDKWEEFKVCSAHSVDIAADGSFIACNPEEIWFGKCA